MTHSHQRRVGYTLVEFLLALALLGVLAGVTVPSALRMFADSTLASAAEQVRVQLAGTRVRAIESGLVYQFRFEPNGRFYVSLPYEREIEGSNPNATGTGGTVGVGTFTRHAGQLPEGFSFLATNSESDSTSMQLSAADFGELPNADELAGADWSAPILFVADGSAVDGALDVVDPRGLGYRLKVRGLTGGVFMARLPQEVSR